ncbi:GroES-like protein [Stipitochalara longipes BDJ]|nr:GroES-like protein [Stipitochalara longipes BDJ]
MVSNAAAWLSSPKAHPFEIKPAPMWTPGENEILIQNHALAINPVDETIQTLAWFPLDYPAILGQDVAGIVAATGPNVTRFKIGDRVLGHGVGMATRQNQHMGFQAYTVVQTNMATEIPDYVTFEQAAVIPLGCSTAACGLFQEDFLNLQLPTEPKRKDTGKTLLIWGGASSVGSNAIQLAVAAGYEVITTASPKNFEYVKKLGASQVFDYKSSTVGEDLLAAFKGKASVGALDCIGFSATPICVDVVHKSAGNKFVSTVKPVSLTPPEGMGIKHIFGTTLKDNKVGKGVYDDFLPEALKSGAFVPAPEPLVVGKGLGTVQEAVDLIGKGVSAKKLVVLL